MLFRAWYHTCQLAVIGFVMTFAGLLLPPPWEILSQIGIWIVVPICVLGALLGIAGVVFGIRTACPICGLTAYWTSPAKNTLAIDCPKCGLVGGKPVWNMKPRVLDEFNRGDDFRKGM